MDTTQQHIILMKPCSRIPLLQIVEDTEVALEGCHKEIAIPSSGVAKLLFHWFPSKSLLINGFMAGETFKRVVGVGTPTPNLLTGAPASPRLLRLSKLPRGGQEKRAR